MPWRSFSLDEVTRNGKHARDPTQPAHKRVAAGSSSLQAITSSRGWTIGSFVFVLRPRRPIGRLSCEEAVWQTGPVLLLNISKCDSGEVEFVVAHLYNRRAAVQRSKELAGYSRWTALVSLWAWPREHTYVLSDDFEIAYEWDLRIWSRSTAPSVATRQMIDSRSSKLVNSDKWLETNLLRALSVKVSFRRFLCLPAEIRNIIYEYALLDGSQTTSTIHTHSAALGHMRQKKRWPWQCDLRTTHMLDRLSDLNSPSLLSVCRQVRDEALDVICRTKTLVLTVTSSKDRLCGTSQKWLPSVSRFLRIRIDLLMACISVETMVECFGQAARLLEQQASSLHRLEFRIGYLYESASAGVRDHGLALVMSPEDIVAGMRQIVPLVQARNQQTGGQKSVERAPIQISWGVNDAQRRAGDFSCDSSYLSSTCLGQMWRIACGASEAGAKYQSMQLMEQDCRRLGCAYHRQ